MEGLEQSVVAAINAATPRYLETWQRIETRNKKKLNEVVGTWTELKKWPECIPGTPWHADVQVRRILETYSVFGRYENAYVAGQHPSDYESYLVWTYAFIEQTIIDPQLCPKEPTEAAQDLLRARAGAEATAVRKPWIKEAQEDYQRYVIEAPFRQDWVIQRIRAVQNFANGAYCDPAVIGSQTKTERTLTWAQSLFDGIGETFLAVIRDGQGDSGAFAHALKRRYGRIVASYAQTMHSLDASEETHSEEFWVLLEMEMLSQSRQAFWCGRALEAEAASIHGASAQTAAVESNQMQQSTLADEDVRFAELSTKLFSRPDISCRDLDENSLMELEAIRRDFWDAYQDRVKRDNGKMTEVTVAANCGWKTQYPRTAVTRWKACDRRSSSEEDDEK